jgi:hypothetical protein
MYSYSDITNYQYTSVTMLVRLFDCGSRPSRVPALHTSTMGNTLSSSTSPAANAPASSIPDEPKAKEPEPLPKPEENVKPANYREAFQVRIHSV